MFEYMYLCVYVCVCHMCECMNLAKNSTHRLKMHTCTCIFIKSSFLPSSSMIFGILPLTTNHIQTLAYKALAI